MMIEEHALKDQERAASDEIDLISAAEKGRLDQVKKAIESGEDVNEHNRNGITALIKACDLGHGEIVKYLLEMGANPHHNFCADPEYLCSGCNAILWAKKREIIEILIGYGADINSRSLADGSTILHKAVERNDLELVKYCIGRDATIDAEKPAGETPLMTAVKFGDLKIVEHLVNAGADVNKQDKIGVSPLNLARSFGRTEIESYLIHSGATIDAGVEEKLVFHGPDGSGDDDYLVFAYTDITTDDGITHVMLCGNTGFSGNIGFLTLYVRLKDGILLDYFVGQDCNWIRYKSNEGFRYSVGEELNQIRKTFPTLYEAMRADRVYWDFDCPIKPTGPCIDNLEGRFRKLARFISNYVVISTEEFSFGNIPIKFVLGEMDITERGQAFLGDRIDCYSSNVDRERLEAFEDIIYNEFPWCP